jgi:hypothetical protein
MASVVPPVFEEKDGDMIPVLQGTPDGVRFFTPEQAARRKGKDAGYWQKVWENTLGTYAALLDPETQPMFVQDAPAAPATPQAPAAPGPGASDAPLAAAGGTPPLPGPVAFLARAARRPRRGPAPAAGRAERRGVGPLPRAAPPARAQPAAAAADPRAALRRQPPPGGPRFHRLLPRLHADRGPHRRDGRRGPGSILRRRPGVGGGLDAPRSALRGPREGLPQGVREAVLRPGDVGLLRARTRSAIAASGSCRSSGRKTGGPSCSPSARRCLPCARRSPRTWAGSTLSRR